MIRTFEMTESESVALPLGDTPKFKLLLYCIKIIKIFQLFSRCFQYFFIFLFYTVKGYVKSCNSFGNIVKYF